MCLISRVHVCVQERLLRRSHFINGCETVIWDRAVLGILTYYIYAPVPALRPLPTDSLSPIDEMTSSSSLLVKEKIMFSNSSIIDALEQITEYEEQCLDPAEVGIALEAFKNFYDPEDLE